MVGSPASPDEVEPFRELRANHGVYFVTGNHDFYSGADDWVSHVSSFGWNPLRNESVAIGRDGDHFDLVGVDDPHGGMLEGRGGEDLDHAMRNTDPSRAAVLLAHDPVTFRRAHKRKVGLQLSGHTHGGQIWPFGWAVRVAVPWVNGHHRRRREPALRQLRHGASGGPRCASAPRQKSLKSCCAPATPPVD